MNVTEKTDKQIERIVDREKKSRMARSTWCRHQEENAGNNILVFLRCPQCNAELKTSPGNTETAGMSICLLVPVV